MMPWLSIMCPRCSSRIKLSRVKDVFTCPTCNFALSSNSSLARLISFAICLLLVPLGWGLAGAIVQLSFIDGGYGIWRALVAFFGFGLFMLLYRRFLRLQVDQGPKDLSSRNEVKQ